MSVGSHFVIARCCKKILFHSWELTGPSEILESLINKSAIEYGSGLVDKYGSATQFYFHSQGYEDDLQLNREIRLLRYNFQYLWCNFRIKNEKLRNLEHITVQKFFDFHLNLNDVQVDQQILKPPQFNIH